MRTKSRCNIHNKTNFAKRLAKFATGAIVAPALLLATATIVSAQEEAEDISFAGLNRVDTDRVAAAYIDPEADFSVFQRVAILDPLVAFRSNWQRDQNRSRSRNIRASDMERIKADVAALFKEVFTERLTESGYDIVDVADYDVLVLRPAIIDLDITAPDVRGGGRSRTYTASAGAATLYLELFDAVSSDIIGRAIDRRAARRGGGMATWTNRVTNTAEARRMFGRWADILIDFLDRYYYEPENPPSE